MRIAPAPFVAPASKLPLTPAVKKTAAVAPAAAASRPAAEVVGEFYRAFEKADLQTMQRLYAPDVKFKDEIFGYDDRAGTMNMWKKILSDPRTKISFTLGPSSGDTVKGHWVADYQVFGRKVHNEISTTLVVRDGKIVSHRDAFDFDRWAKQALPAGRLLSLPGFEQLTKHVLRTVIDR